MRFKTDHKRRAEIGVAPQPGKRAVVTGLVQPRLPPPEGNRNGDCLADKGGDAPGLRG